MRIQRTKASVLIPSARVTVAKTGRIAGLLFFTQNHSVACIASGQYRLGGGDANEKAISICVGARITARALVSHAAEPLDTWTARNPLPTGNHLYAIAYGIPIEGNTNFIAVGQSGTILTSGMANIWVTRVSGTNCDLFGVAYRTNSFNGPQLVAVGTQSETGAGNILVSPDGINWASVSPGTTNPLYAVTYGQSSAGAAQFVAVGGSGAILVSGDGINWSARASGTTNAFYGVAYGNVGGVPTFVTVGLHINGDGTSSGAYGNLAGVTFGDGDVSQFIAVGNADLIVGATHSVRIPLSYSPVTGAFLPIFNLPFGRIFTLHFSSNLVNWSVLTNAAIGRAKPALRINDPSATNFPNGFYSISIH